MHNESLIHTVCWSHAHAILSLVGHLLREEEQKELFAEAYNQSRTTLEAFCIQSERQAKRIAPSMN